MFSWWYAPPTAPVVACAQPLKTPVVAYARSKPVNQDVNAVNIVHEIGRVKLRKIFVPPRQNVFPPRNPVMRELLAKTKYVE